MDMRNKHDRDPEWEKVSYPTQEDIIEFNRKENKTKRKNNLSTTADCGRK